MTVIKGLKDPEDAARIERVVKYTEAELTTIKAVKYVTFGAFPISVGPDPWMFYTLKGMQKQINAFAKKTGFVYYWGFTQGKPDMFRMAVIKA